MGVSPQKDAGKLVAGPKEQAQLLKNQFRYVFSPKDTITTEETELRCPSLPVSVPHQVCKDIHIMEEGVKKLLLRPQQCLRPR